jgi:hypothetical protein
MTSDRSSVDRASAPPARHSRRQRQLREITALAAAGEADRAAGLALEHLAQFPEDAARLAADDTAAIAINADLVQEEVRRAVEAAS